MANYEHRLTMLASTKLSAAKIRETLTAEGHKVSLATVGRKLAQLRPTSGRSCAASPRKGKRARTALDVLGGLPPADHALVQAWLNECAAEDDAAFVDKLGELEARAAALPKCATCGFGVPQ